jgi:hypothetical protein
MLILAPGAQRPDLTAFQRLVADARLALQFRGGHELLDAFGAHRVAEVRIPELGGTDALLLFLDPPTYFERQANSPLQVLVADRRLRSGTAA